MVLLALCMALAGPPVSPDDPAAIEAEARRLVMEIKSHAADGKTSAVEREYRQLLALGVRVDPELHVLAADVARDQGDSMKALARLYRVPKGAKDAGRVVEFHDNLLKRYAYLRVSLPAGTKVEVPSLFSPDEARAAERLAKQVEETGVFIGLVPEGRYVIGSYELMLQHGVAFYLPPPPGLAVPTPPSGALPSSPPGQGPATAP